MVYTCSIVHELSAISHVLYIHTILNIPVEMKHNMFTHFLGWFNEPSACYECITFFWIIISPVLVVSYQKPREEEQFITEDIIRNFHVIFKHHFSIKNLQKWPHDV